MPFNWPDPNVPPTGLSDTRAVSGDDGHSLSGLDPLSCLESIFAPEQEPPSGGESSTRRPDDWASHRTVEHRAACPLCADAFAHDPRYTGHDGDPCWSAPGSTIPAYVVQKLQTACYDGESDDAPLSPFPVRRETVRSRSVYAFTLCLGRTEMGIKGVFCPDGFVLDEDGACESLPALVGMLDELQDKESNLVYDYYSDMLMLSEDPDAVPQSNYRQNRLTVINNIANHLRCTLEDALGHLTCAFLTQNLERRLPEHLRGSANAARRTQFVYMDGQSYRGMLGKEEYNFEPHMLRFPDC